MNRWYNYIHSYFYTIEDNKDNIEPHINKQINSNVALNQLFVQEQINFEKNIRKYNPKFEIQKPFIKINQD